MNHHGDYKTRYDILVFAGDSIESGVTEVISARNAG
ncbi:hypothetical protein [Dactylosporangium sp. CA-233914]